MGLMAGLLPAPVDPDCPWQEREARLHATETVAWGGQEYESWSVYFPKAAVLLLRPPSTTSQRDQLCTPLEGGGVPSFLSKQIRSLDRCGANG